MSIMHLSIEMTMSNPRNHREKQNARNERGREREREREGGRDGGRKRERERDRAKSTSLGKRNRIEDETSKQQSRQ